MTELPAMIAAHWTALIVPLLFVYALIALLITTVLLIKALVQVRHRLAEVTSRDQLLAIFAQTGLKRFGAEIVEPSPSEVRVRQTVLFRRPFRFWRARREIGRLYRDRLFRVQFFTAVAGLLVIAALGSLQNYLQIMVFDTAAGPAFVLALALILLFAVFGQMATDAATKSLFDKISKLRLHNQPTRTLLLTAETDRVDTGSIPGSVAPAMVPILHSMECLIESIDRGHTKLREPMMQLAASAEVLAAMAKAISERPIDTSQAGSCATMGEELKTAIERLTAKIDQLPERLADAAPATYPENSDELKTAIDRLTAKIGELLALPADSGHAGGYVGVGEGFKPALDLLTTRIDHLAVILQQIPGLTLLNAAENTRGAIKSIQQQVHDLLKEFE